MDRSTVDPLMHWQDEDACLQPDPPGSDDQVVDAEVIGSLSPVADSHRIRADRVMWKADADVHDVSGPPGVFLELVGIHNLAHVDVTV